jgi:hypothetical protein
MQQRLILLLLLLFYRHAHAAQPLVTDDISTQGRGNQQIELNVNRIYTVDQIERVGEATYTYGALDNLDIFFTLPRQFSSPSGFTDSSLLAKWRFWEAGNSGMALRPELLLPTGNESRGLGTGSTSAGLTWIGTADFAPWTIHTNVGLTNYRYNLRSDREANRRTIWRASAAAIHRVSERWQLVGDIGLERNIERRFGTPPAFFLAGFIYSPDPQLDFDAGFRTALNCRDCSAQIRRQITAGVTWRF